MNRNLSLTAFLAGLLAVAWVGTGYVGTNLLALAMILVIAATYLLGALEMLRFRQATASLAAALAGIPADPAPLGDWLARIHPSLRNAVRLRLDGERTALPGPALTPYLAALLVMLGMLGTFLGMVVTLNGAVIALESTTDLQTIRASLAAPIKGLGLAFGTSVAGVAASAMLGLISALARRERQQAAQSLDAAIATTLRGHSLAHQRQETFKALQVQAHTLPDVADKLQALMESIDRRSDRLNEQLLERQEALLRDVRGIYGDLAAAFDRSLKASLAESARVAGETLQPLVDGTLSGLARQSEALHERLAGGVAQQLDGISTRFGSAVGAVESAWASALANHERTSGQLAGDLRATLDSFAATFEQRSAALLSTIEADHAARDEARSAAQARQLEAMAASLRDAWQQAGDRTLAQQQQICATLERTAADMSAQSRAHARDTIGEVSRLMQVAAAAPQAAAEVIGALREEVARSTARDNALLEERARILATLDTLLDSVNRTTTEQRSAIATLVETSARQLAEAGERFGRAAEDQSARVSAAAAEVAGGAVEVASLGETLGFVVRRFGEANDKLAADLARIEAALDKSAARHDEQLAYYVAQAREIIDLSLLSQKQILDELQGRRQVAVAAG